MNAVLFQVYIWAETGDSADWTLLRLRAHFNDGSAVVSGSLAASQRLVVTRNRNDLGRSGLGLKTATFSARCRLPCISMNGEQRQIGALNNIYFNLMFLTPP